LGAAFGVASPAPVLEPVEKSVQEPHQMSPKLGHKKNKLMWEQEQKLMFCDVSILEPDVWTCVLAMREDGCPQWWIWWY